MVGDRCLVAIKRQVPLNSVEKCGIFKANRMRHSGLYKNSKPVRIIRITERWLKNQKGPANRSG